MAFCLFGVFLQGNGDLLIEWLALGEAAQGHSVDFLGVNQRISSGRLCSK